MAEKRIHWKTAPSQARRPLHMMQVGLLSMNHTPELCDLVYLLRGQCLAYQKTFLYQRIYDNSVLILSGLNLRDKLSASMFCLPGMLADSQMFLMTTHDQISFTTVPQKRWSCNPPWHCAPVADIEIKNPVC